MPLPSQLTPAQAQLLFIDIQPGIIDNAHTNSAKTIRRAAETSVKVAKLFDIPVFVSLVPTGPKSPEAVSELEDLPTYTRHFFGAINQPEIATALAATGRKTLAIGGIVSEVAVFQGALSALREGYDVHILVDCCGGLTERTEQAAFRQIESAGGTVASVASFFTTLIPDIQQPHGMEMLTLLQNLMAKE